MAHEGNDQMTDQLRDELSDPRVRIRIKVSTNAKHEIQWESSIEGLDDLSKIDDLATLIQTKSDLLVDYLRRRYDSQGGA